VKTLAAWLDKAAAVQGDKAPPEPRPATLRQAGAGNQAMLRQLAARAAAPAVPASLETLSADPSPARGSAVTGNAHEAAQAKAATTTDKSPASTPTPTKSASSATSAAVLPGRTIRVTGWPKPITIYGTFGDKVEAALADGWLSRIEIEELKELPLVGSGSAKDDRDHLFRWLTGHYPYTSGFSALDLAEKATYLSLSGYQDLPARMNVGSHSPNRYLHWLAGGPDWGTVTSQDLAGLNLMARSMFAQINAEPDIAPDDKAELIRLHYLRAMANCNISWGATGPRIGLTIAGTSYKPLTGAEVDKFRRLDRRTIGHLKGLRSWINTFQVSSAVGIFAIP
jgi:hypothetical protein